MRFLLAAEGRFKKAARHFEGAGRLTREDAGLPEDDFLFYHETSLRMLSICREKADKPAD